MQAPMPSVVVVPGMTLRLEAIHPTTGAAVANVTASAWAIYGAVFGDAGDTEEPTPAGPFMLVPGPALDEVSP